MVKGLAFNLEERFESYIINKNEIDKPCNVDLLFVQQSAKELDYLIRESTQKVNKKADTTERLFHSLSTAVNPYPYIVFFFIILQFASFVLSVKYGGK